MLEDISEEEEEEEEEKDWAGKAETKQKNFWQQAKHVRLHSDLLQT